MFERLSKGSFSVPYEEQTPIGVIDIGTSKITCLIGEAISSQTRAGDYDIIGVGHHACSGVGVSGLIEREADKAILSAVEKANKMAGTHIDRWHVVISGQQFGFKKIAVDMQLDHKQVLAEDLKEARLSAKEVLQEDGFNVLHMWSLGYELDGFTHVQDPLGMQGELLTNYYSGICVPQGFLENIRASLGRVHQSIASFVAAPFAIAKGSLQREEHQLGTLCVDLGATVTSFSYMKDDALVTGGVLPIGSHHVTSDISQIFGLPLPSAERAKTVYGTCYCSPGDELRMIDFTDMMEVRQITIAELAEVVGPRMEEILEMIVRRLNASGEKASSIGRVVFTGGGSQLTGVCELAENLLGLKARNGKSLIPFGAPEITSSPCYAAGVGAMQIVAQSRFKSSREQTISEIDLAHATQSVSASSSGLQRMGRWLMDKF